MHTILAVAASHERHQFSHEVKHRSASEIHHGIQSVFLYNQKLSRPFDPAVGDSLWATAALLGIMTIGSFEATDPEEVWPLAPPSSSDLDWFRFSVRKSLIFVLTNPTRPGGLFHPMAHECAQFNFNLPASGASGIPIALSELCNITTYSTMENNPYFVAAHILARLQNRSRIGTVGIMMITFVSQSQLSFENLLTSKDPVALLLLALWYALSGSVLWWIEKRARVESRAIYRYLMRFHGDNHEIQRFFIVN